MKEDNNINWDKLAKLLTNGDEEGLNEQDPDIVEQVKRDLELIEQTATEKPQATDAAWHQLHGRLQADGLLPQHRWRHMVWYKVAVVLVVMLGFGLLMRYANFGAKGQHGLVAIETGAGETRVVLLADGSQVTLNERSRLQYPTVFSDTMRQVYLQGEAFFEVAKMSQAPFWVDVETARVKVLGTSFNVDGRQPTNVQVFVKTGLVQLSAGQQPKGAAVKLYPGELGTLNQQVQKSIPYNENALAWRTKVLSFKNENLASVLMDLSKAYHTRIVLENGQLDSLSLSSTSFNGQQLDDVLQVICATLSLNIRKENNKTVLY